VPDAFSSQVCLLGNRRWLAAAGFHVLDPYHALRHWCTHLVRLLDWLLALCSVMQRTLVVRLCGACSTKPVGGTERHTFVLLTFACGAVTDTLIPNLTVEAQLMYAADLSLPHTLPAAAKATHVAEAIRLLGLEAVQNRQIGCAWTPRLPGWSVCIHRAQMTLH
jgi:hypothetical protein